MTCDDTRCLYVGEDGLWIEQGSAGYGALTTNTSEQLNSALIAQDGTLWAVGDSGVILVRSPGKAIEQLNNPSE